MARIFTVAAMAELIRNDDVDPAAAIERLRTWTTEGLLTPLGDRNPGSGKHRTYDESSAYDAAILNNLADAGFPIGKQRYFLIVLLCAERAKKLWQQKSSKTLYLEIARFIEPDVDGGHHAVFLHESKRNLFHPRSDGSYILNVTRLFARVEKRMKQQGLLGAPESEKPARRKQKVSA
jgi:DNA-binding transcriptional MerR regulator